MAMSSVVRITTLLVGALRALKPSIHEAPHEMLKDLDSFRNTPHKDAADHMFSCQTCGYAGHITEVSRSALAVRDVGRQARCRNCEDRSRGLIMLSKQVLAIFRIGWSECAQPLGKSPEEPSCREMLMLLTACGYDRNLDLQDAPNEGGMRCPVAK
jgi:hypothetical protein